MTFINKPSEFFRFPVCADPARKSVYSGGSSFAPWRYDYRSFAPQPLRETMCPVVQMSLQTRRTGRTALLLLVSVCSLLFFDFSIYTFDYTFKNPEFLHLQRPFGRFFYAFSPVRKSIL